MNDSIYELEKSTDQNNQYTRRDNIEIIGIDNAVQHNRLEPLVVEILNDMGINKKFSSYDIAGCHRLMKKGDRRNKNVIIRFKDRRVAELIIENKRNVKNVSRKLTITENLCPKYQKIYNYCNKMYYEKRIFSLTTYKGAIYVKFTNNLDEKSTKIMHYDDLFDLFPGEKENSDAINNEDDIDKTPINTEFTSWM